jgi:hypothetical protein
VLLNKVPEFPHRARAVKKVREGHKILLRGEFLNAFNHPSMFGAPDANPASSSFGKVTTIQTLPRIIQFGLKYIF